MKASQIPSARITKRLLPLLALLSFLFPLSAHCENAFVPYVATYSLNKKTTTIAQAVFRLERTDNSNHWTYSSHAEAKGLAAFFTNDEISEISQLKIVQNQILPLQYQFKRGPANAKSPEKRQIQYDWDNNTAIILNNSENSKTAITPPTFDILSLQLALIQAVKNGREQASFQVIDDGELEQQDFKLAGRETVHTPMGDYEAIKMVRHHGKRETISWFAPELNYIPIKIRSLRENKLKSELVILSAKFN